MSQKNVIWLSLICVLNVAACATPAIHVPLQMPKAELPPPPANVMVKRDPTFQSRLLNFLSDSPEKPTK